MFKPQDVVCPKIAPKLRGIVIMVKDVTIKDEMFPCSQIVTVEWDSIQKKDYPIIVHALYFDQELLPVN